MELDTLLIHSGRRALENGETSDVAVPISMTSAYQFESSSQAANRFALTEGGMIYARINNPTVAVFEKRLADLEGGVGAIAVSSGQQAALYCILNICNQGDNFLCSVDTYGGTVHLFQDTLKRLGITCKVFNANDADGFIEDLIDTKTKCIFGETIPNPKIEVFPIKRFATLAHRHGIPLIIDNTCAPYICRPIEHGADIVMYSTTKYISGHGIVIGGAIIDSGNFDWTQTMSNQFKLNSDETEFCRFTNLTKPDSSYNNLVWTEHFGKAAYIARLQCILLRDLGGCMSPFNAWASLLGLETLGLRMKKHCDNANKVAAFLNNHPKVKFVKHPSVFTDEKLKANRDDILPFGLYGSLMGIELNATREECAKFIESLKLFHHVANLGDAKSLATHPATTTHSQLTSEQLKECGISDTFVRLSIGIEDPKDIIEDLDQALNSI